MRKDRSSFISIYTKLFHPKSIRRLFIYIFTGLILLFILIFLITSLSYSTTMRNRIYDSIKDTLSVQNSNISQNLQTAMGYLSENCLNNSDISYLNTTTNVNDVYVNISRIKKRSRLEIKHSPALAVSSSIRKSRTCSFHSQMNPGIIH